MVDPESMDHSNVTTEAMGPMPDTKVLAVASHVTYGYVGNTMATFVMQSLGCEVAAINTVHFSNHTGYQQFRGTKTPASEIEDLYDGLKASHLTDFDVLLSGYIPSAESLTAVWNIARDLRSSSVSKPGSFFWLLDPVMGDQGKLYVSAELVTGYRNMMKDADLIVPNQFELSVLTGIDIGTEADGVDLKKVKEAISLLHYQHGIRHVVVTSIQEKGQTGLLHVVGSTSRSDGNGRMFFIKVPVLNCFFSGTGDMFAALLVGRLREACQQAGTLNRDGWISDDEVLAVELPLAKAMCKVLDSMHAILDKTMMARNKEMEDWSWKPVLVGDGANGDVQSDEMVKRRYLASTKAAEVRVVQNVRDLAHPLAKYQATALED